MRSVTHDLENLPPELDTLKGIAHWVAWKAVPDRDNPGRVKKMPVDPHTGENAKANDAGTWGTYQEALSRTIRNAASQGLRAGQNHGIGFEFGLEPCGFAGIDLDHVIQEDGTLKPFAREIVDLMNSYTEFSPSRKGLHILFKLKVPLSEIGSRNKNAEIGLEIYDHKRFLTVTGEAYGEVKPIEERTEELRQVYSRYMAEREKPKPKTSPPVKVSRMPVSELEDSELWERMFSNPANGGEIAKLYNGDISGHNDDNSGADLALCNHLAFWTANNASRIDTMFRQSGLMRAKWDEKHSGTGETYGAMTIRKAIAGTTRTYDGSVISPPSKPKKDSTKKDAYPQGAGMVTEQPAEIKEVKFIPAYIDTALEGDIGRVQRYATRKTGYSNLDAKTSLYPGLYVLGGVSSLGKTTFAHQMGDQLSRTGEHVLYFCLEQTQMELVTKGLSRLTAQEDFMTAISSIEIRSGRITDSVRRAIAEYKRIASHEAIIECSFMTTINTITATVQDYMSRTGASPIVFLDYLQLIRPLDKKQTTKDAVDEHLRALKMLQMKNNLVIVLISSLNRQNYLTTIDYESFKESGGIEYTADVIWGLQLSVMNDELFNTDKKLKEKRALVRQAKKANPRRIELLCLKNRYGVANYSCYFDYYAKYDLFVPVEEQEASENDVLEGITNGNKRKRF